MCLGGCIIFKRRAKKHDVNSGAELTLYPSPLNEAPWRFTGWLGDDASLVVDGVVEMTEDVALGAGFTPEWVLVLEDPGITVDPEPYYTGRYLDGGKVTLTAVPPEGYPRFRGNGPPVGHGESGNVEEGRK